VATRLVDDIRRMARDRLRSGDLPREHAALALVGVADGTRQCAVCGDRIPSPMEFRVRLADDSLLYCHLRCHYAWLMEREAFTGL
jgi:hypothetical protein